MNEQKYKFEFTQQQLIMIDKALQEMPYRIAAVLINDINKQISEQAAMENNDVNCNKINHG